MQTMAMIYILLLLACQSSHIVASAECVPYPVAARIGNVTLSNGQVARGAALSVGTPAQEFAFLPQWPLNNVLVYGTNGYCVAPAPQTQKGCTTWRGGQYDAVASTSRRIAKSDSLPADPRGYPNKDSLTDTVKINGNVTLPSFPIGTPLADWGQEGYYPMMAIGMGKNSTMMDALLSTGKIVSRTWSMFYGWTGANSQTQVDGSLIFGGYDRAKTSGQGFKMSMTEHNGCETQLMVTISDMVLNFPNGTTRSLFQNSADSIVGCIVPDYPVLMTIPLDPYFEVFQNLTKTAIYERTFGLAYYSMVYSEGDTPYAGDMTIKLQSGPSIRIPNHELVVPDRYIDPSSGQIRTNGSTQNLVLNTVQNINAKDLPKLGRQFLSSAYLMVDEDQREFTLWPSNPTTREELVAIDKTGNEHTTFCGADSKAGDSATGSPAAPSSKTSSDSAKPLSVGLIAGIAVGGAALIAIVGIIAFICLRRKRKSLAPVVATTSISHPLPSADGWNYGQYDKFGTTQQFAELPYESFQRDGYWKPELQASTRVRSMGDSLKMKSFAPPLSHSHYELPG